MVRIEIENDTSGNAHAKIKVYDGNILVCVVDVKPEQHNEKDGSFWPIVAVCKSELTYW